MPWGKKKKAAEDDAEVGRANPMYSKVGVAEAAPAGGPKAKKDLGFGFAKKKSREEIAKQDEIDLEKELKERQSRTSVDEDENQKFAIGSIGRAEFMIKIFAIMQNPQKIKEILSAKNLQDNMEDHYGTNDPLKVTEMIFADLQDAVKNGTWSIGRMAFFGGAYAAMEGFFAFLPPGGLLQFVHPLAGINMLFLSIFGVIIMTVESTGDTVSAQLKSNILKYCAALDEIWGRGLFYMYVGSTQILGPTMHLFGYYMFFVGAVMCWMYYMTSQHIMEMKSILKDDKKLEEAFNRRAGVDKVLNREELTNLLSDLGLELTHAELEMMLKRLDPDHDGYISLSELKTALSDYEVSNQEYYTIGPLPKMDPLNGDAIKVATKKGKGLEKGEDGLHTVSLTKVKKAI